MNLKEFKAGQYKQQYQYKSFSPKRINRTWIWDDPAINVLLEDANRILELFYQKPLLNVKEIEKFLSMTLRTIRNVLKTLEAEPFIVEYTGNKRNRKYVFDRYFKLF
ncbi:MAG: HTH domain-containing protein [Desulfobacter sp.]|nr:MAG: HTH domain-containing protein [Desulfobacter sp.]